MARINFIVPRLTANHFSGGIWCIFEYAHGLHARGHQVSIVPILPSPEPQWFGRPVGNVVSYTKPERLSAVARAFKATVAAGLSSRRIPPQEVQELISRACTLMPGMLNLPFQSATAEDHLKRTAPPADIQVATSFETVRPTALLPGTKFNFLQHFEPYFCNEYPDPSYAQAIALQSYGFGFGLIANSSWLVHTIQEQTRRENVALCPNAINHDVFHGEPKPSRDPKRVVLISYGGRNAQWKGFREMAEAVALARAQCRDIEIEWRVYGDALLPPDNPIASYTALGFLKPARLAEEYRDADILLSASWYESFPLFPIEAMACGLAVVTTQAGTEEYALAGRTAEIVEPRNPASIAAGLIHLLRDPEYRFQLAREGNAKSREFTWQAAVSRFEKIVLG